MDDLSSLNWSQATSQPSLKPLVPGKPSYPSHRPKASPLAQSTAHGTGSSSKPAIPAIAKAPQDSFSNLLNFGPDKSSANLSLREQQEKLEAEKRRQEDARRQQLAAQFGSEHFWDSLGSTSAASTTNRSTNSPFLEAALPTLATDDHDLFAAFKRETKVDNASHYPPPSASKPTTPALDLTEPGAWKPTSNPQHGSEVDDPFGLNQFGQEAPQKPLVAKGSESDDLLGDLGLSVDEVRRKRQPPPPQPGRPIEGYDSSSSDEETPAPPRARGADPFNKAVAQICDYGFSTEDARRGLKNSGAGTNVQAAVNWLLDDAHSNAKERALGRQPNGSRERTGRSQAGDASSRMRDQRSASRKSPDGRSVGFDGDLSKTAAAMSANFLKTANTLWKTGQKKVQQAVADFQQEGGDPNQPKWLRSPQKGMPRPPVKSTDVTDEALMLESGMDPGNRNDRVMRQDVRPSREQSPNLSTHSSGRGTPKWQQAAPAAALDSRSRLSRLTKEDDDLPSYSSPHRRRTPQPEPPKQKLAPEPGQLPEIDLLVSSEPKAIPHRPAQTQANKRLASPSTIPKSAIPRTTRHVPHISPATLQNSTRHRLEGTSHFKRGDFASAYASYTSSISGLPPTHPLVIVLLTNRALTNLKTGSPKEAVDDADAALRVIGPSCGHGETVLVAAETGIEEKREMKDLYGKAMSRKAEALEQMEKWSDASAVWQACVESGIGGPTAIKGRQRCMTALAPKPKVKPKPKVSALSKPSVSSAFAPTTSAAVERLRVETEAASREDKEKFALHDKLEGRISAWRDGKTNNLRALLSSLDSVLWEGSGWEKVGLHDLVVAGKVKASYMKAIAKTHPDKLPTDTSTEVRLIAAGVFSTLNESWDKFKADNGL